ncbi:MAG: serine/threonine protein kinase, partial [Myxococcales bacterium]|nr:serine/threonine protein kinase [Myxococcales bacterium]
MRVGDVLAERFVIEALAGSGGMAEVYRARDRSDDRAVAIKVLHGQDQNALARFQREVKLLAALEDPRFVHYIDHGTLESDAPYLVMEWLEGEDLRRRLAREPLSIADSLNLIATLAEAMAGLHARGIVHRDLKPSNIYLVGARVDRPKILDFGIAHVGAATQMTATGMFVGTFGYMAPEQANGAVAIDARADVFSLGCLLYECIVGRPAFAGPNPMAILAKILFDDPPSLAAEVAVAPALDALLQRLLAKDPLQRPPNGQALAEALRSLEHDGGHGESLTVRAQPRLTLAEQSAAVLIFIGPKPEVDDDEDGDDSDSDDAALLAEAAAFGVRLEPILGGSAVAVVEGMPVATDLAVHAARCALALQRCAPGRHVALVMGRSDDTLELELSTAIDRGTELIRADWPAGRGQWPAGRGQVTLDETMVGLLDARFHVQDDGGVFVLYGERGLSEIRTLLGKPTPCVGRR